MSDQLFDTGTVSGAIDPERLYGPLIFALLGKEEPSHSPWIPTPEELMSLEFDSLWEPRGLPQWMPQTQTQLSLADQLESWRSAFQASFPDLLSNPEEYTVDGMRWMK